jgi:release factor glutamine methyltransferase
MVIRDLLTDCIHALKWNRIDNAIFEANLIVRTVLGLKPIDMVLRGSDVVDEPDRAVIESLVKRRCAGEPLQYMLGTQEFMSLEFKVTPDVLIPRADTETLVEHVLMRLAGKGAAALDIGTGSGCIAVSIAYYDQKAYVRGIDISRRALDIAQYNAKKNGVNGRVLFERRDIIHDTIYGRYDVIVSNPPYIETDEVDRLDDVVKAHEPRSALDGGGDGLDFYRAIIKKAPKMLNENGILALEVGFDQAEAVETLMKKDFTDIERIKDLCGVERVVSGRVRT